MNTLRKGKFGAEVSRLQKILKEKGYPVVVDGNFGSQTYLSVCRFQTSVHLPADGIVGKNTWQALLGEMPQQDAITEHKKSTAIQTENSLTTTKAVAVEKKEMNFKGAAEMLGVEEAAVRAVHHVESGGRNGFLPDGRPLILFEGHIFWKQLRKNNIVPEKYVEGNEDILFPKWDRSFYKGGAAEYERLNRAIKIHPESAYCAASWGMFQIMGFNYQLCGYNNVFDYVADMKISADKQLLAFVKFLQKTEMDILLKKLDWAGFAAKYNGPGYQQNQYDEKLEYAYLYYKKDFLKNTY
jgi:hypothetical protein